MKKIERESLRKIIYQEIKKIGEDIILQKKQDNQGTPPLGTSDTTHTVCQVCMEDPCECNMYDEQVLSEGCGCGSSCSCQSCKENYDGNEAEDYHKGAYMSKSQLFKVSKYADRLYKMIPEGHNLEDWMRTKISQISDDISEVYHALDYDLYEEDM